MKAQTFFISFFLKLEGTLTHSKYTTADASTCLAHFCVAVSNICVSSPQRHFKSTLLRETSAAYNHTNTALRILKLPSKKKN